MHTNTPKGEGKGLRIGASRERPQSQGNTRGSDTEMERREGVDTLTASGALETRQRAMSPRRPMGGTGTAERRWPCPGLADRQGP